MPGNLEPLAVMGETWAAVEDFPTTINKVHQSCYRADYVLRCVSRLIQLGATAEVIRWFLDGAAVMPQKEQIVAK